MSDLDPAAAHPGPATWRSRRAATGFAVAYGVAVVLVGFWGSPVDAGAAPWLDRVIAAAHRLGAPAAFDYATIESLANMVFFVPLGLLVVLFSALAGGGQEPASA